MALRGPRLEFAVGAFLLLGLASLLVLAIASTNRQWGFGGDRYALIARFSQIGQLRAQAPVKIGGVIIGQVAKIDLDPTKFDSVVTLSIDDKYKDLPADTSAAILTSGLLGESYVGLQPGGDPDTLKPGQEIAFTQPAVDLIQLVGKYMFGGGSGGDKTATPAAASSAAGTTPPSKEHQQ
ncbi:outer membrane lipid asymmetry maintenance protein MlaD [Xanthomonas sp. MUS 060]|uniref:outer membrane lipid asymmetry maintenance protein MlaD n=1 Tax=Xanthomonas sp. MUS 060 TaxID=1588031 RepID=UPI0005F27A36|nr:outer membrane lipid asymmetry maintenance protein MlaD [Xanthomonas sp. MUS 060]